MRWPAKFFRWHRWLGWVIAIQVLAWVAGGVVFTWLPFASWVKAEAFVRKPQQTLPGDWAVALERHVSSQPPGKPVLGLASAVTARGPAWRLRHADGDTWIAATGGLLPPPDAAAIGAFARRLYTGPGTLSEVRQLGEVPARALIVREAGGRRDLWRASFDDTLSTRLYFDGRSGELVAVRNDAWVLYDFFWRLHLMDYREGEDFNHPLVRGASLLALALVGTGIVLSVFALRRRRRQHRGGERSEGRA